MIKFFKEDNKITFQKHNFYFLERKQILMQIVNNENDLFFEKIYRDFLIAWLLGIYCNKTYCVTYIQFNEKSLLRKFSLK